MANLEHHDLVSIHRKAARLVLRRKTMLRSAIQPLEDDVELSLLQERLAALKKRRLELFHDLGKVRFDQTFVPLSQDIMIRQERQARFAGSVTKMHSGRSTPNTNPYCSTNEHRQLQPLAERMHELRKHRCLVGSHRILSGISIIPTNAVKASATASKEANRKLDIDVFGIRLDIALDGRYVAKHFVFLDVVRLLMPSESSAVLDDDGSDRQISCTDDTDGCDYYLRLVQHTLPSGVTLRSILQRHFGDNNMLLLQQQQLSESDMATLRNLIGDVYDACYAYAVRKEGTSFLRKYADDESDKDFAVQHLVCDDTFRRIDFEFTWKGQTSTRCSGYLYRFVVTLEYGDELNPQPTKIHVSQEEPSTEGNHLIRKSIEALRSLPLWNFFYELGIDNIEQREAA